MAEKEYIERGAVIRHLSDEIEECGDACESFRPVAYGTILGLMGARSFVNTFPAADVAPVVHGEWMPSPDGINPIKCRRCGTVAPYRMESDFNNDIGLYPYKSNYCPNCGAKMDGKRKEATP